MTIERALDLCENYIEQVEKMTPEQWEKEFAHYLIVTRPELAATQREAEKAVARKKYGSDNEIDYDALASISKQFGLNLKL